jgi:hypothetical protein
MSEWRATDDCTRCRARAVPVVDVEIDTFYPPVAGRRASRLSSLSVQRLCGACMVSLNEWLNPSRPAPSSPKEGER